MTISGQRDVGKRVQRERYWRWLPGRTWNPNHYPDVGSRWGDSHRVKRVWQYWRCKMKGYLCLMTFSSGAWRWPLLWLLGHSGRCLENLHTLRSRVFLTVASREGLAQADLWISAWWDPEGNPATIQNFENKNECCKLLSNLLYRFLLYKMKLSCSPEYRCIEKIIYKSMPNILSDSWQPSSLFWLGFLSMTSGDFPHFVPGGHLTASAEHSAFSPQPREMHFICSEAVPSFSKQGSVSRWLRHRIPFSPDFHSGTSTWSPLPMPDLWHRKYPWAQKAQQSSSWCTVWYQKKLIEGHKVLKNI